MSGSVLQAQAVQPAWIERLYDRVVDGAWRIAMRSTGDEARAEDILETAFREHLDQCGDEDHVCVLRHVLTHANALRSGDLAGAVERRHSLDIRDAFELVYVGGVRLEDVARAFECTTAELSQRLLEAVRPTGAGALA